LHSVDRLAALQWPINGQNPGGLRFARKESAPAIADPCNAQA
jgi:hypothetical protein